MVDSIIGVGWYLGARELSTSFPGSSGDEVGGTVPNRGLSVGSSLLALSFFNFRQFLVICLFPYFCGRLGIDCNTFICWPFPSLKIT